MKAKAEAQRLEAIRQEELYQEELARKREDLLRLLKDCITRSAAMPELFSLLEGTHATFSQ